MTSRIIRILLLAGMWFFLLMTLMASHEAFGQSYTLSPYPELQFFDNNGVILSGGWLCSYQAGTTTPLSTYSNSIGTVNSNPLNLNSAGRGNVWLSTSVGNYKLVLYAAGTGNTCNGTSVGTQIWSIDQIAPVGAGSSTTPFTRAAPYIYPTNSGDTLVLNGTTAGPLQPGIAGGLIVGSQAKVSVSSASPAASVQLLGVLYNNGIDSILDSTEVGGVSSAPWQFDIGGSTKMQVQSSGDISIGTTNDNGYNLDVQGATGLNLPGPLRWGGFSYTAPPAYPAINGYVLSSTTAGVTTWVASNTSAAAGWVYSSPFITENVTTDRVILGATTTDVGGSGGLIASAPGFVAVTSATSNGSFIEISTATGSGRVSLASAHTGSGTTLPLDILVGGTVIQRNQTSGNLTVGGTTDYGYKLGVNGSIYSNTQIVLNSTNVEASTYGFISLTAPSNYGGNPIMPVLFKPDGIDWLGTCLVANYPCGAAIAVGNVPDTTGSSLALYTDHGSLGSPQRLPDLTMTQGAVYMPYIINSLGNAYMCYNTATGELSYEAVACVSNNNTADLKLQIDALTQRVQQLELLLANSTAKLRD